MISLNKTDSKYEFPQKKMGYMCPNCYGFTIVELPELFLKEVKRIDHNHINIKTDQWAKINYCFKCESCDEIMVEIDADWVELISRLNKLGYKTRFCCSGHEWEGESTEYIHPYIMFEYDKELIILLVEILDKLSSKYNDIDIVTEINNNNILISFYCRGTQLKQEFIQESTQLLGDIVTLLRCKGGK